MTLPLRPAVLVRASDEIQRRLLLEKVDFLGYEPVVAADDDDALAIAQVREFAAILCVHLGGATDCRELVRRLRAAYPTSRAVPVVTVTEADDGAAAGDRTSSAEDEIRAPVTVRALAARLHRWVSGAPGEQLFDGEMMATLRRFRVKQRVFSAFRAALPGRLAKIHAALVVRARPELQRAAHELRGAATQAGAVALAHVLADLEFSAGVESDATLDELGCALEGIAHATSAALTAEIDAGE